MGQAGGGSGGATGPQKTERPNEHRSSRYRLAPTVHPKINEPGTNFLDRNLRPCPFLPDIDGGRGRH